MSALQTIAKEERDQILENSIEKRRHLTLTHHGESGWRMHKTSFASGSASSRHLDVRVPIMRDGSPPVLPKPGATLGVTFRLGHKKCMFFTTLETDPDQDGGTLRLRWPNDLRQLQRRVFERAAPPADTVIPVRFWREGGSAASSVEERNVRHGQLENLSAGGMRVKVSNPDELQEGDAYRCVFTPRLGKAAFVLDVLVRHREAAEGGRSSIGFQYVGLETTPDGHRTLQRIAQTVTQFQRAKPPAKR